MRKRWFGCLAFVALVLILGAGFSLAEEVVSDANQGKVSLPWEEFRKLLELDKDEVVLSFEEFRKLLIQTGSEIVPAHTIKEGKVVLKREQFKKLLDQMKPPVALQVKPPADYLITKAAYQGRMEKDGTSIVATFRVNIFKKERQEYVKIPLFPAHIALREVLFDKEPALIVTENNMHQLITDRVGEHLLTVSFSLKTSLDRGPHTFSFPVPRTPITVLDLEIPLKDIGVEVAQAEALNISKKGNLTSVSSILSPTTSISVSWHKEIPEADRGPAKIYAQTTNLLSIEEDALRVNVRIDLSILQNTISSLGLVIPQGYDVLDVQAEGIGDWKEYEKEGVKILVIP